MPNINIAKKLSKQNIKIFVRHNKWFIFVLKCCDFFNEFWYKASGKGGTNSGTESALPEAL